MTTSVRSPVLSTLTPIEPDLFIHGSPALQRLVPIEWLEIAAIEKDGDVTYYVVHIFTHHDLSRLHAMARTTTTATATPERRLTKPSGQVEPAYRMRRRFSEFVALRTALMDAVQSSHHEYCHLCNGMQFVLLFSATRLAMAARSVLVSPRLRAIVLNRFLVTVLNLLLSWSSSGGPRHRASRHRHQECHGSQEIPLILVAFLFGSTEQHP